MSESIRDIIRANLLETPTKMPQGFTVIKDNSFYKMKEGEVYKPTGKDDPNKGIEYGSDKNTVWLFPNQVNSLIGNRVIKL